MDELHPSIMVKLYYLFLYIKTTVWAMPGRFFQSLPVPCGASPDVIDSREKRNQGQSNWFFEAKDLVDQKKNI